MVSIPTSGVGKSLSGGDIIISHTKQYLVRIVKADNRLVLIFYIQVFWNVLVLIITEWSSALVTFVIVGADGAKLVVHPNIVKFQHESMGIKC